MLASTTPTHPAIVIYTRKTLADFRAEGGTSWWVIAEHRIKVGGYAVITFNPSSAVTYPHGFGWMVGRISAHHRRADGRVIIHFDQFAEIALADCWPGHRNPVAYTTLEGLGIDPAALDWQAFVPTGAANEWDAAEDVASAEADAWALVQGVLDEARDLIVKRLNIAPASVHISIKPSLDLV